MHNLRGKNVVVMGNFTALSRGLAEQYLQVLGARVRRRVDDEAELVFVGSRPGVEQSRARALGLTLLREPELLETLGLRGDRAAVVDAAWDRVEAWLSEHAVALLEALPGPASDADVEALSGVLGAPLPDDVRAHLARHDGALGVHGASAQGGLLSARASADVLERARDEAPSETPGEYPDDPRVREGWPERWLPVWRDGLRDRLCVVDLDPAPVGRRGQIVECGVNRGARVVRADGFALWLHAFAHDLENGCYAFNGRELARVEPDPEL